VTVLTKALGLGPRRVFSFLDLWHLLEKLGKAAKIIWGADAVDEHVRGWKKRLLRRQSALKSILAELRMSGK